MIELSNINKFYQVGDMTLHVLKDISLTIEEGEFVSIMGPSGSGKSTLVNVLGFLDANYQGEYYFDHTALTKRNDKEISQIRNQMVGFVFQDFNLINTLTVEENVQLPLLYRGYSVSATKEKVKLALEKVGLGTKLQNMPTQLSGGQKQRVAIARALVNQPRFIIADEPTGALDSKTSRMIMTTLEKLNREDNVTIVMVTHDPTLVDYTNRRIMVMDGVIHSNEKIDDLTYTQAKSKYEPLGFDQWEDQRGDDNET